MYCRSSTALFPCQCTVCLSQNCVTNAEESNSLSTGRREVSSSGRRLINACGCDSTNVNCRFVKLGGCQHHVQFQHQGNSSRLKEYDRTCSRKTNLYTKEHLLKERDELIRHLEELHAMKDQHNEASDSCRIMSSDNFYDTNYLTKLCNTEMSLLRQINLNKKNLHQLSLLSSGSLQQIPDCEHCMKVEGEIRLLNSRLDQCMASHRNLAYGFNALNEKLDNIETMLRIHFNQQNLVVDDSNSSSQQQERPTGSFSEYFHNGPSTSASTEIMCKAARPNNLVSPGIRANNYWDNFRSFSRQNIFSSSNVAPSLATSLSSLITNGMASPTRPTNIASVSQGTFVALTSSTSVTLNNNATPLKSLNCKQNINREQNREVLVSPMVTVGLSPHFIQCQVLSAASHASETNSNTVVSNSQVVNSLYERVDNLVQEHGFGTLGGMLHELKINQPVQSPDVNVSQSVPHGISLNDPSNMNVKSKHRDGGDTSLILNSQHEAEHDSNSTSAIWSPLLQNYPERMNMNGDLNGVSERSTQPCNVSESVENLAIDNDFTDGASALPD